MDVLYIYRVVLDVCEITVVWFPPSAKNKGEKYLNFYAGWWSEHSKSCDRK